MYQGRFSGSSEDRQTGSYDEDFLNDPIFNELNMEPSEEEAPDAAPSADYPQEAYGEPQGMGYQGQAYYDPQADQGYGNMTYGDPGYEGYPEQTYGDPSYYEEPQQEQPRRKIRKGPIIVGVLFYLALFACVGLFYMHIQKNLQKVEQELLAYEQAQPVHISQQVFEGLFGNPDWMALYEQAGLSDTDYEGREAFAAYMDQRVGGQSLSFRQLSFDQTQALEYGVFAGSDQVAAFTIRNHGATPQTPDWQKEGLTIYYKPVNKYRISLQDGQKVAVNGVALDDSLVIQEEYLQTLDEEKRRLPGTKVLEIREFLVQPTVTAESADGKALVVSFDEKTNTFQVPASDSGTISEEQKQLALDTIHTYCKYMINKAGGPAGLSKYFKQDTATFKAIVGSDLTWVQKESGHNFANEELSDYVSYGDKKFSVHVDLTWQLTRPDGSVKESPVEKTLVFEKFESGWLCTRMTGFDLVEAVRNVRLTFWNGDTVLDSALIRTDSQTVTCPKITAPEGKKFAGWAVLRTAEDGSRQYQRVLMPEADGTAPVASGLTLEPMDLYPLFEAK